MNNAFELNEKRFVSLLDKLIAQTKSLQNNPPEFVPEEDLAGKHVLEILNPHSTKNNGPLTIEHIAYVEGRGNIIISYPSAKPNARTVSFVGSHLDVVPANPKSWIHDPFKLTIEGDKLYGRGTTDCLGHVALLTDLFLQLAETKPSLDVTVSAVFIASEENTIIPNVGVEELLKHKKLDFLKNGPIYWVDSADSQPCIGTAGAIVWQLTVNGKLFHSGLPDRAINPIELGLHALNTIQNNFYRDFPPHPSEAQYNFSVPSTMKPIQIKCPEGGLNQIPPSCTISGDIRLTPFYDLQQVQKKVSEYVKQLNENLNSLPTSGPVSKYVLSDGSRASIELSWLGEGMSGIACDLKSAGFDAINKATEKVLGQSKPYSICGSLPLVKDLQSEGFDVQIVGFGLSSVYHGDNEYIQLSDMKNAMKILSEVIIDLNHQLKPQ